MYHKGRNYCGVFAAQGKKMMTQQATTMNRSTATSAPAGTGEASGLLSLKNLEQAQRRLEALLDMWTAQVKRTEAQLADVKLLKVLLLKALSPDNKGI